MPTKQTTLIKTLRDLGQSNEYADFKAIVNTLKQTQDPEMALNKLFNNIDVDFNNNGHPTTYGAIMKYCIGHVKDDLESINDAYRHDGDVLHATNFYDTQEYGAILHNIGSMNDEVEGEIILNTTYADKFTPYTYEELADELASKADI